MVKITPVSGKFGETFTVNVTLYCQFKELELYFDGL